MGYDYIPQNHLETNVSPKACQLYRSYGEPALLYLCVEQDAWVNINGSYLLFAPYE